MGTSDIRDLTADTVCDHYSKKGWSKTSANVPREIELRISVNGQDLITILCTAAKLDCLVIGYLYAEGIISSFNDVAKMSINEKRSTAEVILKDRGRELPKLRTLGCSGGTVFHSRGRGFKSGLTAAPTEVLSLMRRLHKQMRLYHLSGGVHTSALAEARGLLVVAEDIGRHNTLNKIQGECLLKGLSTKDRILLITGRISSEMLLKAVKMEVPIVVSRHSPTDKAIKLARELGVALVGEARGDSLTVFTHPERLGYLPG